MDLSVWKFFVRQSLGDDERSHEFEAFGGVRGVFWAGAAWISVGVASESLGADTDSFLNFGVRINQEYAHPTQIFPMSYFLSTATTTTTCGPRSSRCACS